MSDSSDSEGRRELTGVFVGNLPPDIKDGELEELFKDSGRVLYTDLKKPNGNRTRMPFGFVEFFEESGASNAIAKMNGAVVRGKRIIVDYPRGLGPKGWGSTKKEAGAAGRDKRYCPKYLIRTSHKVHVSGLPENYSWQDLKDYMRKAGNVNYVMILRQGFAMVEFGEVSAMDFALRHLDGTYLLSRCKKRARIQVKPYLSEEERSHRKKFNQGRTRSRSRSRSPIWKKRSRSRSPRSGCAKVSGSSRSRYRYAKVM